MAVYSPVARRDKGLRILCPSPCPRIEFDTMDDFEPDDRNGPIRSITEPGIKLSREVLPELRREVADLLGRSQTSFPGAQPVSFARKHLLELTKQE